MILKGSMTKGAAFDAKPSAITLDICNKLKVKPYKPFYLDTPNCKISQMSIQERHLVLWQPLMVRYDGLYAYTGERLQYTEKLIMDGLCEVVER